ncbi:hypothetical protein DAI22_04g178450 [Oryza sativa Japonica Group]|nr:hypothetical protein DAI22_04g178450 [Oryza sativa Japonica Group]
MYSDDEIVVAVTNAGQEKEPTDVPKVDSEERDEVEVEVEEGGRRRGRRRKGMRSGWRRGRRRRKGRRSGWAKMLFLLKIQRWHMIVMIHR